WFIISNSLGLFASIFTGHSITDQLSGPIGIARITGEVAGMGWIPLINLAGILSVSIGLINLFPIPILDGGHLLFQAIEALRGRPLSQRIQEIGTRFGLAFVLGLMLLATYNDVVSR